MLAYYYYFGFSFLLYILHIKYEKNKNIDNLIFYLLFFFIILFTGIRYQVGSDWQNYHYEYLVRHSNLYHVLLSRDIGFSLLNFVFRSIHADYIIFNLFLSFISIGSLFLFCKKNPNWFIGVFMAIPYFFIVCVTGYVRQGVAIGIIFLSIYAIQYNKKFLFIVSVLFAVSIHKSTIIFFPLFILFYINKNNFFKFFLEIKNYLVLFVLLIFVLLFFIFITKISEQWHAIYEYIKQDRHSSGALIRSITNLIPAIIFILFNKKLQIPDRLQLVCYFFTIFSILSFCIIVLKLLSSTFIDRFGLSIIIFHVIIFSRVSNLFSDKFYKHIANFNIIFFNFLIMITVLHYSVHARFLYYKITPLYRLF